MKELATIQQTLWKEHGMEGKQETTEPIRNTNAGDPILTAKEVAKDLRCSKSQVSRLMKGVVEGLSMLPHLPLGRKKVVPRSALEAWKRENISGMIPPDSEKITVDAMH